MQGQWHLGQNTTNKQPTTKQGKNPLQSRRQVEIAENQMTMVTTGI